MLISSNYTQLGLAYSLSLSEITFNRGLARLHFGQVDQGMADLVDAQRLCVDDEQSRLMAEAIRKKGLGAKPISIPVSYCAFYTHTQCLYPLQHP